MRGIAYAFPPPAVTQEREGDLPTAVRYLPPTPPGKTGGVACMKRGDARTLGSRPEDCLSTPLGKVWRDRQGARGLIVLSVTVTVPYGATLLPWARRGVFVLCLGGVPRILGAGPRTASSTLGQGDERCVAYGQPGWGTREPLGPDPRTGSRPLGKAGDVCGLRAAWEGDPRTPGSVRALA